MSAFFTMLYTQCLDLTLTYCSVITVANVDIDSKELKKMDK